MTLLTVKEREKKAPSNLKGRLNEFNHLSLVHGISEQAWRANQITDPHGELEHVSFSYCLFNKLNLPSCRLSIYNVSGAVTALFRRVLRSEK